MNIIKNSCKSKSCGKKNSCCKLPLELNINKGKRLDMLIIGEHGRSQDKANAQPFNHKSNTGHLVRTTLKRLTKEFTFNYGITLAVKDYLHAKPNIQIIDSCKKNVYKEIVKLNPKVIVCLGEISHSIIHNVALNSFNIFNEEGCIRTVEIKGKKCKTISSIDPAYLLTKDYCSVGFFYNVLFKACIYLRDGVDFNISNEFNSEFVTKVKHVKALLKDFKKSKNKVAVDTETNNLGRAFDNEVLCIQIGNDGKTGYTIPLNHFDSPFSKNDLGEIKAGFIDFFTTKKSKVSGYIFANPKFDMHQFMREFGFVIYNAPVIDINFNAYLLEENWSRFPTRQFFDKGFGPFSLGGISYKHGFNFYYKGQGVGKDKRAKLSSIPIKEWLLYACADACAPWGIWRKQLLMAKYQKYLDGFKKMALPYNNYLSRVLTYVEHCGLPTNIDKLRELYSPRTSELLKEIEKIKIEFNESPYVKNVVRRLRKEKTGYGETLFGDYLYFDPNKRLHTEELFFTEMGLQPVNSNKKSDVKIKKSIDKKFQEAYSDLVEVKLLTDWNRLNKLQTGYINNIFKFMNKTDGSPDFYTDERVRPQFLSTAVTGRLKAHSPNSQQRVSHGDRAKAILQIYEAKHKRCCMKIDYSAFEVRGLAIKSKDKALIRAFADMHKLKNRFRKNPYALISKKDDKITTNLKDILLSKIRLDFFHGSYIHDHVDYWLKKHNAPNDVKKDFVKFVLSVVDENSVYNTKDLKEEVDEYFKKAIKYILAKSILKSNADIHRRSAATFNRVSLDQVTPEMRQNAKNLVFGSIYGRGIPSIAQELGITKDDAKALFELFKNSMPDAFKWLESTKEFGRKNLFIESPFGRRRRVWGFLQKNGAVIAKMERLAQNSEIQGFCSDLNIIANALIIDYIYSVGKGKYQVSDEQAWFVDNLVHDSGELEIPILDIYFILNNFEKYFTSELLKYAKDTFGFTTKVPIEIDFDIGISYSDMIAWDGTQAHAKHIQKEMLIHDAKRRGVKYNPKLYKKALAMSY